EQPSRPPHVTDTTTGHFTEDLDNLVDKLEKTNWLADPESRPQEVRAEKFSRKARNRSEKMQEIPFWKATSSGLNIDQTIQDFHETVYHHVVDNEVGNYLMGVGDTKPSFL